MASKRTDKVNELIRTHLATIIAREIEFPKGVVVAVTRVVSSGDLKKATVSIRVYPDSHAYAVLHILKKHFSHIQHLLDQHLKMYAVPRLRCMIEKESKEESAKEELEIEKLFEQIQKE
ncbi:ribosome-binding factor A [Candidatus Uhrbacteria bacterium]|nr:ribosome-binding factor A [Candidatus Uhrbacteria bacterium]